MAKSKKETLRFNSWTRGGRGADIFEKGADALEMERVNPLRGVDEWRLGQIFDDARDGIYADLAWLYNEIEGVEPALVTCCDMRESAAAECGWLVNTADATRTRGFDQTLADEQRDALLAEFGASEDDIRELAGHLVGAFFRGAAHALPLWNEDGSLSGFKMLDLWNFAYDRETGIWYWNADASRDEGTFQPIPPGELVTVASTRHVDHAALPIFIRAALGAKRYGVWLDRFGIPPVGVIMPANAERGEQAAYMELARKFARGGSGILPNGASVVYGTEARAVCPFIDFIRFQQQQIYTVGIGRVQSGETDAANLGGNAAGVVEDGFRRIVRRDARRIARAINDTVTRKVLGRLFPGRPALAQFAWDMEAKRTAHEVLEDASLAKNAGLAIDIEQLSEMTGYTLEKAPETPAPGLFGGLNSDRSPKPSLQTAPESFKTPSKKPDGQGEGETVPELLGPFLRALQSDSKMISEEVEDLLNDLTPEKARALLDKLPELVPEDPTLAPLLAEEMAKAFGEAFTASQKSHPSQESQEVVATNDIANPCPKCHRNMPKGGTCSFCAKRQANHTAGKAAFAEVAKTHQDKIGAMERDSIGKIDFIWGDNSEGVCHILQGHSETANQIPGVIAYGDVYEDAAQGKYYIIKKRYVVVLRKQTGSNHYLITGFRADSPDYAANIRKGCTLVEKSE